jgi:hypothetical protein
VSSLDDASLRSRLATGRNSTRRPSADYPPALGDVEASELHAPAVSYQVRRRSLSVLASQSAEVAIKKGRWRISMPAAQFMEK